MLQTKKIAISLAVIIGLIGIMVSCDDNPADSSSETGTLQVVLHDAPANYEAVNVYIESVEVNNSANEEEGWITISNPEQTYDLLELVNGATEVLGEAELQSGTYEQIRLILGDQGHSLVVDGTQESLFIPSGAQTGIKLNVDAVIEPGITYTLLLDFDASRSVVKAGNSGRYLLKPVIDATNEAITGSIAGSVEPAESEPFIYAVEGPDTLSSTKANAEDGSFQLIGLEEGTYTIAVDPTNEVYNQTEESGVAVEVGETTEIGTLTVPTN